MGEVGLLLYIGWSRKASLREITFEQRLEQGEKVSIGESKGKDLETLDSQTSKWTCAMGAKWTGSREVEKQGGGYRP